MIRRNKIGFAAFLVCLGVISSIAHADDTAPIPRLAPVGYAVRLSGMEEPLSIDSIIEASLIFSEVPEEQIASYSRIIVDLADELKRETDRRSNPVEIAEQVLLFMHEKVLRRYVEPQTRMDVQLDTGDYNCVSSAVLYLILARSVGFPVGGVRTKDHAFCYVKIGDDAYDVETTNVYGFNPGEKKEFHDQFGNVTGYSYTPPGKYSFRMETDERGLLALILQNRTALLGAKRKYPDAVGPAVDAFFVLRDEDSYEKMVSSLLNVAAVYAQADRYEEALLFIDDAIQRLSIADEEARTQYPPAARGLPVVSSLQDSLRRDARLAEQRANVFDGWISELFQDKELERAKSLVKEAYEKGELSAKKRGQFLVYIYQVEAQDISRGGRYLQAMQHVQAGLAEVGADSGLLRSLEVYRHNYEAKIHNSMVHAYNAGKYEEAKQIIQAALEQMPDSENLKKDLELIEETLKSQD